ncbi:MAG: helix-turn-helix domain-containing protein [Sulfolobales archaeon]|nr:helix-turn-helix domain-containing protein [Sulfolobales archaeon]
MSYKVPHGGFDQRKREVKLLLERVKTILSRNGYSFEVLNYPSSYRERSIDLVAVKDGSRLLLRVKLGIKNVHKDEVNDLINAASAIDAVPLVLNDEITYDNVVHEREGLYVISDKTLNNILRRTSDVFLIQRKNSLFIRMDSKKLERIKAERGLSLGDLALSSGVSRRMIFHYLRNDSNVSLEVAERLIEVLGEDIIDPITMESLKLGLTKASPDTTAESTKLLELLELSKDKVTTYRVSKSAPDFIIISRDGCEVSFVVEGDVGRITLKDVVRKILETEKLTRIVPSDIKTVLRRSIRNAVLDELSVYGTNLNKITVISHK